MRGYIAGLETPHPLGPALPALYQDDDFVQRMLDGLDAVAGAGVHHDRQLRRVPRPAASRPTTSSPGSPAGSGSRWTRAGTRRAGGRSSRGPWSCTGSAGPPPGLAGQVEIQTGGTVEIVENGATGWSVDPGGELPGSADPLVVVRVTVPDPKAIDAQQLDTLVATAKPAHVMHRIEIVKGAAKA